MEGTPYVTKRDDMSPMLCNGLQRLPESSFPQSGELQRLVIPKVTRVVFWEFYVIRESSLLGTHMVTVTLLASVTCAVTQHFPEKKNDT